MTLVSTWFIIIAALWTGFFVLEGFDLGVGMLHDVVGHDETGRRMAINTIGPLWDGNEVWLVVAAAGMFSAFPGWYATMFSAFYMVFILLLVALIVRGVSFEFRGKVDTDRWRRTWDILLTVGSLLVPLLVGIGLGGLLQGVPIGKNQEFTGSLVDLLTPYGVFVGVTLVLLCILHGASFLALKTTGDLRTRATRLGGRIAPLTGLAVLAFAIWTHVASGRGVLPNLFEIIAVLAVIGAAWAIRDGHEGWSFLATTFAMATTVLSIFVELYPNVMVSSTSPAFNLTVHNTASGSYSLKVMTVIALVLLPIVVLYQGWTYHVFRQRLRTEDFQPAPTGPPGPDTKSDAAAPDSNGAQQAPPAATRPPT
ncbi:MAG TPA: cytochrome d ubiquinol oxidase subunit II [Mycobacteriales bacterium]|jgi:cytochrome d ubiquinol oxidase subunit II